MRWFREALSRGRTEEWCRLAAALIPWTLTLFVVLPSLVALAGLGFTNGVYIGTGIAVLWYTLETASLRREAAAQTRAIAAQTEVMVSPLLVARVGSTSSGGSQGTTTHAILVRNIGRGPALSVKIQDLIVDPTTPITLCFDALDVIRVDEEAAASGATTVRGAEFSRCLSLLKPEFASTTYELRITYLDMAGREHTSAVQMGKGGIRLLRHS